ncbi:MAG: GNAT family N-acetyltransferase [Candidatus Bipolaricaulis sp.]|nr:GNAT family N-acetyltransferase [Candidatus Bipolaricaulis sp.]
MKTDAGSECEFVVRPYRPTDRHAVRHLAANDEFERPCLLARFPKWGEYRADGLAHFYDLEPESCFVAAAGGKVVGNLLGTVDARRAEEREETFTRALHRRRMLRGAYGVPLFLIPVLRTNRAPRLSEPPPIDPALYPAELHIGVDRAWRRHGAGRALVSAFERDLQSRGVPGYRVFASSYHADGVQFFGSLGLKELGRFEWRLHDSSEWRQVTEHVFVRSLR